MNDLKQDLLFALAQRNSKPSTIRLYTATLKRLQESCPQLLELDIKEFLKNLKLQGRKSTYINGYVDLLRILSTVRDVYVPDYFKEENFIKATMSDEEIEAFLALPCPVCSLGFRNGKEVFRVTDPKGHAGMTMFWSICAYTGMRMGEVAAMTVERVDFGRGIFILEDTKTNTPRFVPIPPNIDEKLKSYIKELDSEFLFPNHSRKKNYRGSVVISDVDWHYNFKCRIKRLGIKRKNLTPYSLRHSFITRLLEEDVNIFKVQKIVGHRQLSTTQGYSHLTTKDIQQAVTKHPLIRRSTSPEMVLESVAKQIESFNLQHDSRFLFHMDRTNGELLIEIKLKPY